jgi:hypothetical protein
MTTWDTVVHVRESTKKWSKVDGNRTQGHDI